MYRSRQARPWRTPALCLLALALAGSPLVAEDAIGRAAALLKNRQYADAVKLLSADLQGKDEAACGRHFLVLGEACYLERKYDQAKPWFTKALKNVTSNEDRARAEYRLACTLYRLKDFPGAIERIDGFAAQHPDDPKLGQLLAYKMLIISSRGKAVQAELEALRDRIQAGVARYDAGTVMDADEVLATFYRQNGQEDKAFGLYSKTFGTLRQLIAKSERNNTAVPPAVAKASDHAALQMGSLAMDRRQMGEAQKWLENVRYDVEMVGKAKLLLAKIAFDKGDYKAANGYLVRDNYVESLPDGQLKSDMYLIIGLAEKAQPEGKPERIEQYLGKIDAASRGYPQAQAALGDLYRDRSLGKQALAAYANAALSPEYAPTAFYASALVHMADAAAGNKTAYRKAADQLKQLYDRFPLSPQAKQATAQIALLADQGIDVAFAQRGEDAVRLWEKTAGEKPGSPEAAQALLSIARIHFKQIADDKGQLVKAPDYAACAAACDRLLDAAVYSGAGLAEDVWKAMRVEALTNRGQCELAAVSPSAPRPGEAAPKHLAKASASHALHLLAEARKLVDPKQLDLVKSLDLSQLEAMFKAEDKQVRADAETRFGELEAEYGNDSRFQKLALDLAEWYRQQGRFEDAAKQYAGVAERAKDIPSDDLMKILFTAGSLYSRAGQDALTATDLTGCAILVYPKQTVELRDDVMATYAPLQQTVTVAWPNQGRQVPAGAALAALSATAKIPFVWATGKGPQAIGTWLAERKLDLPPGPLTVEAALGQILDPTNHRVAFDLGLSDGTPTFDPAKTADADPEAERPRTLEIFDQRLGEARHRALAAPYGKGANGTGGAAMLFNVLERVSTVSKLRVTWAPGIDKQEKLAAEYKDLPREKGKGEPTVASALDATLTPLGLRWRVVALDVAGERFEAAKECFNKVRKIDPKSTFGERALIAVALNCYAVKDYERMKLVLKEYLRVFDSPTYEHYQQASFWVGWTFENGKQYHEACAYYARAAEERLVLGVPAAGAAPVSRAELKARLSSDTQFALGEAVKPALTDLTLEAFAEFVRINCHVSLRIEPEAFAVAQAKGPISRPEGPPLAGIELISEVIDSLGLTLRPENVNREYAERAYFRLATCYKKQNMMEQALENCRLLLARFPTTARAREVEHLSLEIYRGLKRYREVIATLERLESSATDADEKRRLQIELAWIRYDLADYAAAADRFKSLLGSSANPAEGLRLRDGLARSLQRAGKDDEALVQYETLAKEESEPLRRAAAALMAFQFKVAAGKAESRELPLDEQKFILAWEGANEAQRAGLSPEQSTRATWIYYAMALIDVAKGDRAKALAKFQACGSSPDNILAADSLYRAGMLLYESKDYEQARETFEYLLFSTSAAESALRGTYALGLCLEALGRTDQAAERFAQVVERYPGSPVAVAAKQRLDARGVPLGSTPAPAGVTPVNGK